MTAAAAATAIIRARAAADPDATAITGDGRPLTFGQLDERSSRLARALAGLGVRRGDRVAYLDQNATEFWETMFAAAKLGAVMTPLNFRLAGPELAAILAEHEGVLEAAVEGVPSPRWGETPVAFVTRRPGCDPAAEELIAFCRERLAHYKCPSRIEWVEALPRNPSGKVLRRTLREPYRQHLDRQVG